MEVGRDSPWVSDLLKEREHEVLVANPRRLRLIWDEPGKTDRLDAEHLARVARRMDPELLRGNATGAGSHREHLAVLRRREALVRCRAQLVTHVRGAVKSAGYRLPGWSTAAFAIKAGPLSARGLQPAPGNNAPAPAGPTPPTCGGRRTKRLPRS